METYVVCSSISSEIRDKQGMMDAVFALRQQLMCAVHVWKQTQEY